MPSLLPDTVTQFVKQQRRNHTFTAVALSRGQQDRTAQRQTERACLEQTEPITQVAGGRIWVENTDGEDQCPQLVALQPPWSHP